MRCRTARRWWSPARTHAIARRAGTDERPLIRLAGVEDPRPLRGELLLVEDELAEDEWLASRSGRTAPFPGTGRVAGCSTARRARVLELEDGTLIPFISDAVRSVDRGRRDPHQRGVPRSEDRHLHAVPALVRLVPRAAPRAQRARARHALETVDLRATTPLKAGQVDDTPYGGGAGMVIRVDVVEAALEARYGQAPPPAPDDRAVAGRAPVRRRARRRAGGGARAHAALAGATRASTSA